MTGNKHQIHVKWLNSHQSLLGTQRGASAQRDTGDGEGQGRPLGVHVEIIDVLEETRQVPRIGGGVADDAHQQACTARDDDPVLLAGVPVTAVLVL